MEDQNDYQSCHPSDSCKMINPEEKFPEEADSLEDSQEEEDFPEEEDFLEEEDSPEEGEYHLEGHQEVVGDHHHYLCHKPSKGN